MFTVDALRYGGKLISPPVATFAPDVQPTVTAKSDVQPTVSGPAPPLPATNSQDSGVSAALGGILKDTWESVRTTAESAARGALEGASASASGARQGASVGAGISGINTTAILATVLVLLLLLRR